jgi:hypothetical protein
VCCGEWSGAIRIRNRETLAEERQLLGHTRVVCLLVAWEGWVISGSSDRQVMA